MYSYISSVDIIVEAVQQLHRVIFSTAEQLFSKDTDCFPQNKFNKNDLDYFKTIRSCFGAHPVNLDEPGNEQHNHCIGQHKSHPLSEADIQVQPFRIIQVF